MQEKNHLGGTKNVLCLNCVVSISFEHYVHASVCSSQRCSESSTHAIRKIRDLCCITEKQCLSGTSERCHTCE